MASAKMKSFEDLDLSSDEVKRLGEALKDEKFRKMLVEYAEEISDPENRRKAEEEIQMMESERGMNIQFVHPKPGYVLKTTVDASKAFINICQNDKIQKPSSKRQAGPDGKSGLMWHIPHSFSPPRDDYDKAQGKCKVYDVVFHPDTYRMAENNARFRQLVESTALEGIERQFDVIVDKINIKRPKMKFKGQPVATVIRERKDDDEPNIDPDSLLSKMPYPYDSKTTAEKSALKDNKKNEMPKIASAPNKIEEVTDKFTTPKHTITHRSNLDLSEYRNAPDVKASTRPNELVIKIELPLLKSAADVKLDIFEKKIILESTVPAAYKLDLNLPYPVNDDEGSAKFDKSKKTLTVSLPVIQDKSCFAHRGDGDKTENVSENETCLPNHVNEIMGESGLDSKSKVDMNAQSENYSQKSSDCNVEISCIQKIKSQEVKWTLPDYQISQDNQTISLVIKVCSVQEKSVTLKFPDKSGLSVEFISIGAGGFPTFYSLTVNFGKAVEISDEHCNVDVSDDNVVLLILKGKDCRSIWDSYQVGLDKNSMEVKQFLTEANLKRDLNSLDEECEKEVPMDDDVYDLSVLEMMANKITIEIKPKEKQEESDETIESDPTSPSSIEVFHRHPAPALHSILKHRTFSESSEDHSLAASSASIASLEDETINGKREVRRTVSFNSHIDSTSFKSNASVSSMVPTLKNKRKKQRRREEKHKKAERRRIRKLSGSEGTSSGEEGHIRESFSDSHSVSEEEDCVSKDIAFHRSISDPGPDSVDDIISDESSIKATPNCVEVFDSELPNDSKKSDKRISRNKAEESKQDEEDECVQTSSKDWNEKVTKEIQSKLAAHESVGEIDLKADSDDEEHPAYEENDDAVKVKSKEHDKQVLNVNSESLGMKKETEVDTMLSWEDGPANQEHVTKCAFQFTNTVMFDLDVD